MASPGYKISATLDRKYAPVIVRGKFIHEQPSKALFPEKRKAGDTNLDLWIDGAIYPMDPRTGKRPRFTSAKDLLEFVGDGNNGLLGYINSIGVGLQATETQIVVWQDQISTLRRSNVSLETEVLHLRNALIAAEDKLQKMNREFQIQLLDLETALASTSVEKFQLHAEYHKVNQIHTMQLVECENKYKIQISSLKSELNESTKGLKKLSLKISRLKKTDHGYRTIVRPRRDLVDLSQGGGHAKATRRQLRQMLAPATVSILRRENALAGVSRRRMAGDKEVQVRNSKVFASIMTRTEVSNVLSSPGFSKVGVNVANELLQTIGDKIGAHEILNVCDRHDLSPTDGYGAIFKHLKHGFQGIGKGLRIGCLPNPTQVANLRKVLNTKLKDFIGEYTHITSSLMIPAPKKSKKKDTILTLTDKNSLFCDIEVVQRTMVQLYDFTLAELNGKPLIFVIKLDEAEIVHGQKLERVSITIMNRILDSSVDQANPKYIAVQSEREIWPVACFQVPKESHEILSWVFGQIKIPEVIAAQGRGQVLMVPGIGEFQVEWHLSADMKSIKCMYGLSHGANSKFCCIYCNQERNKLKVTTVVEASAVTRAQAWDGGLFSTRHKAEPVSGNAFQSRFKPILDIPLARVHICTLHASNRMLEKICHLHFQFAWTIRDKEQQALAIESLEKVLSATGAHGGDVKILKDETLSGKVNSVPNKPSLNGVHVAKLFKPSTLPGGSDRLWKDLVNAERNLSNNGEQKRGRHAVWQALEELRPYFTGLTLTDEQRRQYKSLIENWGALYIRFFGEGNITHYLHVMVKHTPWFVQQYGSLSIWSCQGMENSHHAAKSAYQRHTQHSGGKQRKSALVQTYEHWYRIIQHRFRDKDILQQHLERPVDQDVRSAIDLRRQRALASSSKAHTLDWISRCERKGSKWVPRANGGLTELIE